ncbi:MAG: GGDEF domain-containing protein [Burkholderiales bacterium]
MILDTRSLVVASLLVATLMGAVSLVVARMQGGTRLVASWGLAILVLAAGLAGIALRGQVPDLLSITVANTALVAGLVLAIRALRIFCGIPPKDLLGWSATALLFVLILLSSEVWPSVTFRIVAANAAIAVVAIRAALVLRSHVVPGCELSFRFTEIFFWMLGLVTGTRCVAALLFPVDSLMQPSTLNSVSFLSYAGFIAVLTLGVMWMEIEYLQKDLSRLARFDSLTGLANRGAFLAEFEREVSRSSRSGGRFSLVMFDLDHFKQLNDRHGHPAGDHVLREFADILRASVRQHDVAGRYGGEEFVVLMPDMGKDIAVKVAERIRDAVQAREFEYAGRRMHVTVSGGVATLGEDGADWDALLKAADKALYAAKEGGRNRIVSAAAP